MSLGQLKRIRQLRLDKQLKVVNQARTQLEQAQSALIICEDRVHEFRGWRLEEQHRLFKALQGTPSTPDDLKAYHTKIESFKQKENQLQDDVKVASGFVADAEKALEHEKQKAAEMALKNEKTAEIITTLNQSIQQAETRKLDDAED